MYTYIYIHVLCLHMHTRKLCAYIIIAHVSTCQHTNLIVWPDGQPHQAKQHDLHSQGVFWRRPRWCWVFLDLFGKFGCNLLISSSRFLHFGSFWLVQVGYYISQFVLIICIIYIIYILTFKQKQGTSFSNTHPGKTSHFSGVFLCSDAASLEVGEFPVWPGPDPTENGGSFEQKRRVVEGWWPEYIPKPFEGNGSPEKWWLEDKLGENLLLFLGDFAGEAAKITSGVQLIRSSQQDSVEQIPPLEV